jgi:hypothetical protein
MHGMGIFRESSQNPAADLPHVYAPVGAHRDLLAYLVRRLLKTAPIRRLSTSWP